MTGEHRCAKTRPVAALDALEHRAGILEFTRQRFDLEALLEARGLEARGDTVVLVRSAHCFELPVSEGGELASTSAARVANWLR
jgi:hypothetical protein